MQEMKINRNMGCIEIPIPALINQGQYRLIETWDVLKCSPALMAALRNQINRNMGCIEIKMPKVRYFIRNRLIETWDVLK